MARLLELPEIHEALSRHPQSVLVAVLRAELERARVQIERGERPPQAREIADAAIAEADRAARPSLARAINATGVVLHTGLGRAALAPAAREAVLRAARGHCLLEVDRETGRRGSRQRHVAGLLCELTGAEAALVVNNNAGAVFLAVSALASGGEVIISRGELVEIGGSFRMPDIIRASGATLVEVGATNRTRLQDFEGAITERTALILRCHPSNFRIVGFTEEVPASDLAALGGKFGIPVMDDLGSGALLDTAALGVGPASTMRQAIDSGCGIVTASGDKLLGGPQAGIILGRAALVERIAAHPLARALRIDKLTLAALEATLKLYLDPERARREIPVLRFLSRTPEELRAAAESLASGLAEAGGIRIRVDLLEERSQVGGGSLPGENLPTTCVRIRMREQNSSVEPLARALRLGEPAVFGRIRDDALLLDPRTVLEDEEQEIARALRVALDGLEAGC